MLNAEEVFLKVRGQNTNVVSLKVQIHLLKKKKEKKKKSLKQNEAQSARAESIRNGVN